MERITVHRPNCPELLEGRDGELAVEVKGNMETLVCEIHALMRCHKIHFYNVVPHNSSCPGRHFPWEDLEFKLFALEH